MTPKQKVMALAKKLGATVEHEGDKKRGMFEVTVEAPPGHHWVDEQVHELVCNRPWHVTGSPTTKVWEAILERMEDGIEPCNDNCEWWEDDE